MKSIVRQPKKSEMCPVGSHIVRGYYRVCESGTRTWVDTHARINRGRKHWPEKYNQASRKNI